MMLLRHANPFPYFKFPYALYTLNQVYQTITSVCFEFEKKYEMKKSTVGTNEVVQGQPTIKA
jgi:hypothetical protein